MWYNKANNHMLQNSIKKYSPVGSQTLWVFIFRRGAVLLLLAPLFIVGLFGLNYVPAEYINLAVNLTIGCFVVLLIILASAIFAGWLQYSRYWIFVGDKDLKMAKGFIAIEQIGVPYKHIQDVKIQRSLTDQIFGVSDVIITVFGSGHDEPGQLAPSDAEEDDTIIMPALSKEIAVEIQDAILRRAQVDHIHVTNEQKIR